MAAIELCGLSAGYRGDAVLHEVTLAVEAGSICALLGANGSGKSTLLRAIAGLCDRLAGSVRVLGDDAARLDRRALARRVALVPQRFDVATGFTVREVVAMGRVPHPRGWLGASADDNAIVAEALAQGELLGLAGRAIETLSGGEQQRVHITRALAQRAPILLLDEAAAHLDIRHVAASYELVARLVRETRLTCLAAMHDLSAAARYADSAALLKAGRLLAKGAIDQVMSDALLSDAFDVAIGSAHTASGARVFAATAGN